MNKKRKLLILSLIASFALTATTACLGVPGGNNSSSQSSVENSVESSTESSVDSSVESSVENSAESSTQSSDAASVTPEYSFGDEEDAITITMSQSEIITQFETVLLSARVSGTDAAPVWTSSNEAVATVNDKGEVLALTLGEAVITATIGDVSASCTVQIVETKVMHEIELSVSTVNVYEGLTASVEAGVSYKGILLDAEEYDFTYDWTLVEGEEDVVSFEESKDGQSVSFTGLKEGSVTYMVTTVARGYETRKEIIVNVLGSEVTLGCANENIVPIVGGYTLGLTLGDEATDRITIGDVYAVENGRPQEDTSVDVAWTDTENVVVEEGVIIAKKAGTSILTGTATYKGEEVSLNLTVNVSKAYRPLDDTFTIETHATKLIALPEGVLETDVEKVWFNDSDVVFDLAAGKGSKVGNRIVFDRNGLPSKMENLGEGQKMTIETNIAYYEMSVSVYTMIIDTADELNQWQLVAADNSVKAGVALEEQKKAILTGYFVLGNDIEYNGVWTPIANYSALWNILTETATIGSSVSGKPGAIFEAWGGGINAGFQGVFDGKGHNINGLETQGLYSGFIVTLGLRGIVKNISFTNAKIGAGASLLVDRGQGTVENIYMEIDHISDGGLDNNSVAPTWPFMRSLSTAERYIKNVLIDYTDCNLVSPKDIFVGCDVNTADLGGVYVVGIDEDVDVEFSTYAPDITKDKCGVYENIAQLLADENQKATIEGWKEFSDMWLINDRLILSKAVANVSGGDISFTNEKEEVNRNGSLELVTDKDPRYVAYELKDADVTVSLNGNVVSVAENATQGSTFTVVVTSLIDGKTAEKQFTVGRLLNKYTAQNVIDVDLGLHVEGQSVEKAASVDVDLSEIFDTFNGQETTVKLNGSVIFEGVIDSETFVLDLSNIRLSYEGEALLVFACSTEEDDYEYTLPLNVIQNNIELNSSNIPDRDTLQKVLTSYLAGNYVLTSDLDMGGQYLRSIATFTGVLDGQGYAIKNTSISYAGDLTGESQYNAHFIEKSLGTVKNIRFEINGMDYHIGSSLKGLVARNEGTISNVYLNINLDHGKGFNDYQQHNWLGLLTRENVGTINNCIVNVTANEKAPLYDQNDKGTTIIGDQELVIDDNAIAAIAYNSDPAAIVENCYVIANGVNVSVMVLKNNKEYSVEEQSAINSMKVDSWKALSEKEDFLAENGWNSYWTKAENGAVSFGQAEIFDNLVNDYDDTSFYADNENGKVTLKNEAFKVGEAWTVVINDVSSNITVETEGELTATYSGLVAGSTYTVKCKNATQAINFTNVLAISQYIDSAEDLKWLGVGGTGGSGNSAIHDSYTAGNDVTGYYVLAGDLDCEGAFFGAGYSGQQSFFKGVFDGNGYTISNLEVGSGGIFGGMQKATVKNVKFTNVYLNALDSTSGYYGNYAAVLTYFAENSTFSDISIQITKIDVRVDDYIFGEGLFVAGYRGGSIFKNMTIDATGLDVECALGFNVAKGTVTYENVVIKANSVKVIGYTGSDGKDDGTGTIVEQEKLADWPTGVTFVEAPAADVQE